MRREPVAVFREGVTTHTLHAIPGGARGTRATLLIMRDLVRDWRRRPKIRQLAKRIVQRCPEKAYRCQVVKLHAWVRDVIKYMRDVRGVETIQAPDQTLLDMSGDCDDKVVLLGALLESIGHPVRFVAIGFSPLGAFTHVLLETLLGPYWVALETTEKWPVGRRPPNIRRHMVQKV